MRKLKHLLFSEHMEEDEVVECTFRHPFSSCAQSIIWRMLLFGGVAFGVWFFFPVGYAWAWMIVAGFGLFRVFTAFLHWYFNGIMVTNQSLMVVKWDRPFQLHVTRVNFPMLQQVAVERLGAKSFFFNYGTLQITNDMGTVVNVERVSRPGWVAKQIEKQREKVVDQKNFTDEGMLKQLITGMVQSKVKAEGLDEAREFETPMAKAKKDEEVLQKPKKRHWSEGGVEVEKKLDDSGGIEIDL